MAVHSPSARQGEAGASQPQLGQQGKGLGAHRPGGKATGAAEHQWNGLRAVRLSPGCVGTQRPLPYAHWEFKPILMGEQDPGLVEDTVKQQVSRVQERWVGTER